MSFAANLHIGWTPFALNSRKDEIEKSINSRTNKSGGSIDVFTSGSDAGGNQRKGLLNVHFEHTKFFDAILSGDRTYKTVKNYCTLLRHQLNIEFANQTGFSSPSIVSITKDTGQYFYKKVFTKLFNPIVRGYKIDDKQKRYSTYSFYTYTKWLYSFIIKKYSGKDLELIFSFLKETLGELHNFFSRMIEVPNTSLYINSRPVQGYVRSIGETEAQSTSQPGEVSNKNVEIKDKIPKRTFGLSSEELNKLASDIKERAIKKKADEITANKLIDMRYVKDENRDILESRIELDPEFNKMKSISISKSEFIRNKEYDEFNKCIDENMYSLYDLISTDRDNLVIGKLNFARSLINGIRNKLRNTD